MTRKRGQATFCPKVACPPFARHGATQAFTLHATPWAGRVISIRFLPGKAAKHPLRASRVA